MRHARSINTRVNGNGHAYNTVVCIPFTRSEYGGLHHAHKYDRVVGGANRETRPLREGKIVSGLTDGTGLSEEEKSEVRLRAHPVSHRHAIRTAFHEKPPFTRLVALFATDVFEF